MEIGEKIRLLRRKMMKNQYEFGKELGITQQVLSHYESGRTIPPPEIKVKISKLCNVPIEYLGTGMDIDMEGRQVKLYESINHYINNKDYKKNMYVYDIESDNLVAFEVHDNSMADGSKDGIYENDIIIVDIEEMPLPGDIVIILANKRQVIRKLVDQTDNIIQLRATNSEFPDFNLQVSSVEKMFKIKAVQRIIKK